MSCFQSSTDARRLRRELLRLGLNSFGGLFEFFELGEFLKSASSMSGRVSASSFKFFTRRASSADVGVFQVWQTLQYILQ